VWFVCHKACASITLCLYCVHTSTYTYYNSYMHSIFFIQACEWLLLINAKNILHELFLYTYTVSFKAKNRRLIMDDDLSFFVQCFLCRPTATLRLVSHSRVLLKTAYFFHIYIYKAMRRKVDQSALLYT